MIWGEQSNYSDDYYFCSTHVKGFNSCNRKEIRYSNIKSTIPPTNHSLEMRIPHPPTNFDYIVDSGMEKGSLQTDLDSDSYFLLNDGHELFSQPL